MAQSAPRLKRKLGLLGATFIGVGSMVGAGVFSAFAPAAQSAGAFVLVALGIAGVVALLNASSSAQLALRYPTSGGTYAFGREVVGPWWGFSAGWSFVIGKTASAAAIALTFAAYVVPEQWQRAVAMGVVALFTLINLRGITRTAQVAAMLVVPVIVVLVGLSAVGLTSVSAPGLISAETTTPYGVLQAAGLLFFAFAGYARITTLGEEVKNPAVTIKRAIAWALGIVFVVYLAFGSALLWALGPERLSESTQPALEMVQAVGLDQFTPIVWVAVALAALGSLLALIAGISRTIFAMARNRDVPHFLSAVDDRRGIPYRAEIVVGIIVMLVVSVADLREAIGFSSAGVLLYYAITNLSAWRQPAGERVYPRWLSTAGLVLCLVLVATLPMTSLVGAIIVIVLGIVFRLVDRAIRAQRAQ